MKIAIVGAEGAKFTPGGEQFVREYIRSVILPEDTIVSGGCHLGGVDIWAEEEARRLGCELEIFTPAVLSWEDGYKPRNILIAENCDYLFNIVVDRVPPAFKWPDNWKGKKGYCYHCKTDTHVKSGGCWTMLRAAKLGVPTQLIVVAQ